MLKPGGGVALIWNARDERNPVQAALSEVIDPLVGDTPRRTQRDWKTMLADCGLFERCERRLFEHEQFLDEQGVVDRVVSISFVGAASPGVRDDVEERVRALVRDARAADPAAVHDRGLLRLRGQLTDGSSGMRDTSS